MRWVYRVCITAMCALMFTQAAAAQDGEIKDPVGDSLYLEARELLNRGEFTAAAERFAVVRRKHTSSSYVNEVQFWQAYALYRLNEGRQQLKQALSLLESQRKQYPQSPVAADVIELATRIRGVLAAKGDAQAAYEIALQANESQACSVNAEVRMAALSALQNMQGVNILPTLRKVFTQRDSCSVQVRERALAIMSVRPISETEEIVLMAAQDPDENIRRRAIPLLAQGSSDGAVNMMGKLLAGENDNELRLSLLSALAYNANPRARRLLKDFVARPEVGDEFKERAITSLVGSACGMGESPWRRDPVPGEQKSPEEMKSIRKATIKENGEYLRDLYKSVKDPGLRQRVVEAVVQVGGSDNMEWLMDVASNRNETIDVRRTALYSAGVIGERNRNLRFSGCQPLPMKSDEESAAPIKTLVNLYGTIPDREIREQLLYAYSRRAEDDDKAMEKLIDVAKHDQDRDLRQRAIFWLSQLKSKKAAKALADIVAQ